MFKRMLLTIRKFLLKVDGELFDDATLALYDKEIEKKNENLQLFYNIVGDNPLEHIDYIIENGLDEFNRLQKSYEDGSVRKVDASLYTGKLEDCLSILNNYLSPEQAKNEEFLLCRSVAQGKIQYTSKLTGEKYIWTKYGDVCCMPEKEYAFFERNSLLFRFVEIVHRKNEEMIEKNKAITPASFGQLIREIENRGVSWDGEARVEY